mmetsp:Transcript_43309/g.51965  ORF Transcript_43309/g.51965 Transcript_43309/m.51965 type:complete len:101 (-) Transcript_43309:1166-1468(-)
MHAPTALYAIVHFAVVPSAAAPPTDPSHFHYSPPVQRYRLELCGCTTPDPSWGLVKTLAAPIKIGGCLFNGGTAPSISPDCTPEDHHEGGCVGNGCRSRG